MLKTKQEAIKSGEQKYFTGKPCKHGHIAERYTKDGNCIECRAAQFQRDFDKRSKQQKVNRSKPEVKEKNYAKEKIRLAIPEKRKHKNKTTRIWRHNNKEHHNNTYNSWSKEKYDNDPNYKLTKILRTRLTSALKGEQKAAATMELIGCTTEELWLHIESKFEPGMTRENNGNGEGFWHLDHEKACANFDLSDPEQQRACFHYTNLQPLWYEDNLKKGAKHLTERINSII